MSGILIRVLYSHLVPSSTTMSNFSWSVPYHATLQIWNLQLYMLGGGTYSLYTHKSTKKIGVSELYNMHKRETIKNR